MTWAYKLRTLGGHSETTAVSIDHFVHYSNSFHWLNIPKIKIIQDKSIYYKNLINDLLNIKKAHHYVNILDMVPSFIKVPSAG
ncbi:hypothetical protein B9T29_06305 [Acinetobacter sp. ANC 3903]|nr:hypothetical protein B9T29_06305 [Acinetobacter sp. ANC 3903]